MRKVAFIAQLPKRVSPGQRFRLELWESVLTEHSIYPDTFSFLDKEAHAVIYKPGHTLKKIAGVVRGFISRIQLLPKLRGYDYIFIQREFAPIGPPVFEWICAKVLKLKIIYDFDDAIWIPNTSTENKLAKWVKCNWKVKHVCKWAYKVVPGNRYLAAYAKTYSSEVTIIPTCVNTKSGHNQVKIHKHCKVTVGWTGSHSTLFYLNKIIPVIRKLQETYDFTFLVIADKKPDIDLKDWQFTKWNEASEIDDLLKIDIGIMPLERDAWSEGKCGFKLIQYLACGIPALADPVGVNSEIIQEGVNGFICENDEEWMEKLALLIKDADLRTEFGRAGREGIVNNYSVQSQKEKFLKLFS